MTSFVWQKRNFGLFSIYVLVRVPARSFRPVNAPVGTPASYPTSEGELYDRLQGGDRRIVVVFEGNGIRTPACGWHPFTVKPHIDKSFERGFDEGSGKFWRATTADGVRYVQIGVDGAWMPEGIRATIGR